MTGPVAPAATVNDLLARALDGGPGSPFAATGIHFVDRDERETFQSWSDVAGGALAVAGRLERLGVEPGERVAIVHPTGPEFFAAFFGTLAAGGVPVPLYPPVRLGRLGEYHRRTAGLVAAAGARLMLADRRVRRILGETVERARPPLGCRTLDELPEAPPRTAPRAVAPGDLALVQFSSGTTVEPKPVALSHRALVAQTEILSAQWRDTPGFVHRAVSWLPLYHDMGLIGCVFPCLLRPTDLGLIPPEAFVARPAIWLRTISRLRGTVSPAPNFAYALCAERVRDEELAGVDLSCWRAALNGAEAVAPAVLAAFRDRFARQGLPATALSPVYGLSEAALAVTFADLERPFTVRRLDRRALAAERRAAPAAPGDRGALELPSVGRPLPGFAIEVRPPEGGAAPLPEGRVGRIWVRGPSLMEGYLGRPEATARALVDGWLDTGDQGFLLDGELYLTGRAKDVVILRGRNYAPEEIEHAVHGVAGLRPGCAVASSWLAADGAGGAESLMLFVEVARDASAAERAALPAACREAVLGETGLAPDEVVVLAPGTLPRTSSGKLRRQETLRRHLAGELTPPEPVTPLALARAFARSGLAFARVRAGFAPAKRAIRVTREESG